MGVPPGQPSGAPQGAQGSSPQGTMEVGMQQPPHGTQSTPCPGDQHHNYLWAWYIERRGWEVQGIWCSLLCEKLMKFAIIFWEVKKKYIHMYSNPHNWGMLSRLVLKTKQNKKSHLVLLDPNVTKLPLSIPASPGVWPQSLGFYEPKPSSRAL